MPRPKRFEQCVIWYCKEAHYGRGFCARHYQNWLRNGDPVPELDRDLHYVLSAVERFHELMEKLTDENLSFQRIMGGNDVESYRCRYCGGEGKELHAHSWHNPNCPYVESLLLIEETTSAPADTLSAMRGDGHGDSHEPSLQESPADSHTTT